MHHKSYRFVFLFTLLFLFNCSKDYNDNISPYTGNNTIETNSELAENLRDVTNGEISCIEFIYPFNVITYDSYGYEVNVNTVTNNDNFSTLITNLLEDYTLSISYPINGINADGEEFSINNNEALLTAIRECVQEEIINNCNSSIRECVWEVHYINTEDDEESPFNHSVFRTTDDYLLQYYHEGNTYRGAWIFYFIEDVLHMNINLDGGDHSIIEDNWNYDWEVIYNDGDLFELKRGDIILILDRKCPPCGESLNYRSCELQNFPGIGEFILAAFSECIYNSTEITNTQNHNLSFYETLEDADADTNRIITNTYINNLNSQILFVRIENITTLQYEIVEIILEAIACEE